MKTTTVIGLDTEAKPAAATRPTGARFGNARQTILAFASLVALIAIFSALNPQAFMTSQNLIGILQATNVIGVMAIAATFVIITAGIDLSIGVLMTFTAVMAGIFMANWGWSIVIGVPATIAAGALIGCISGLIITKLKVAPFIATLGMMMVLKGVSLIVTGAKPIYFSDVDGYDAISLGSVVGKVFPGFALPNGVLVYLVVAIIASILLKRTALGRYTFALGSNEEAVRLSGVNVDRWKVIVYALGGGICSISGLLISSRLNSAQPALGQGYELDAIAAVVIGGTSLAGGQGTILGSVIGAFIMSVLINGLRIMSVADEWQMVLTGIIIIAAVYTDNLRHKKA